jgi:hypothetical protein
MVVMAARLQRERGERHLSWGRGAVRREVVRWGWWRVRDWTSERRIAFLGRAARIAEGKVRERRVRRIDEVVAMLRRIVLD